MKDEPLNWPYYSERSWSRRKDLINAWKSCVTRYENSVISQLAVRILLRITRQWIARKGTNNPTMGKKEHHAFQVEKLKTKMQRFVWKERVKTQRNPAQLKGRRTRDSTRDLKQMLIRRVLKGQYERKLSGDKLRLEWLLDQFQLRRRASTDQWTLNDSALSTSSIYSD